MHENKKLPKWSISSFKSNKISLCLFIYFCLIAKRAFNIWGGILFSPLPPSLVPLVPLVVHLYIFQVPLAKLDIFINNVFLFLFLTRLDNILGKPGQQDRRPKGRGSSDLELFDPSISLLSRVVKVERRVTLIDRKLDMLIELYRDERHSKTQESRSEEKDDSHESELEVAPKGFHRRGWSPGVQRTRDGTTQRHESTDTSSATSPADNSGAVVAQHKLTTSHPSLLEDYPSKESNVTVSTCPPQGAQAQPDAGGASSVKRRLGSVTRDSIDETTKEETTSEPKKLSRRWKRPGAVRIRPARSAESVNCPQSGDSVSYSSGRQSSMGSLAPSGEGETRIWVCDFT